MSNQPRPREWIGVDFDGTLAVYTHWVEPDELGEPIPAMVERVKRWIAERKYEVRIMTARASNPLAVFAIEVWCLKHLGEILRVTDRKDYLMAELWDDRAISVEMNTGRQLAPSTRGLD